MPGLTFSFNKNVCPYCGNNPVPHFVFWYDESLNILFTPLRQRLLYNPLTKFLKNRRLDQKIWHTVLFFLKFLGVIKIQDDPAKSKVRRAQVLWEEAGRRDIQMQELLFFGKAIDVYSAQYTVDSKKKEIVFSGLPRPLGYINHRLDLMDDKAWLKKLFEQNYLPVPKGAAVSGFAEALKIFQKIQEPKSSIRPVIVKPRTGSRGRHSTTFVFTQEDLKKDFKVAKQLCYWVIVEEQLFGPVYRATVINFELCGVLRGDPPQIVGDGTHSIRELVFLKNQLPHKGVKDIKIDLDVEMFLFRQKLNLTSVLNKDQIVNLSEKIGVNYGGSSSEDFEACHPDNKELFEKAAKVLGDPIVGFDFIIQDITKTWKEQKCGFIEANSLPFINLHHDPLYGQSRNVAAKVWDLIERKYV